jgi:hypothetical protein
MSTINILRNHLEMVQQSFSNALTESSIRALQPPHITTPLFPHQLATLSAMRKKEEDLRVGMLIQKGDVKNHFYSYYSILGDSVGSGKTLSVLGHISQMAATDLKDQTPLFALHPKSLPFCFSIGSSIPPTPTLDTLIVVPHTIYHQWKYEISSKTTQLSQVVPVQ